MQSQNRQALPVALLTTIVGNLFLREGAQPLETERLLPFPPERHHLSIEDSMAAMDSFFGHVAEINR